MKFGQQGADIKTELDPPAGKCTTPSRAAQHPEDTKVKCSNLTAEPRVRDGDGRGTSRPSASGGRPRHRVTRRRLSLAAYLYKRVVDNFTADQFAKFRGFPAASSRTTGPRSSQIKLRHGRTCSTSSSGWAGVRAAFGLRVVSEAPKVARRAPEAAYGAVLCYQNIYGAGTHQGGSDRKGGGNTCLPARGKK